MAYQVELWKSDRPARPIGGGEVRELAYRVQRLEQAGPIVDQAKRDVRYGIVRITLEDTRGKYWDLWRHPDRDTTLDAELRTLIDLRPAGAAVAKVKRRG